MLASLGAVAYRGGGAAVAGLVVAAAVYIRIMF